MNERDAEILDLIRAHARALEVYAQYHDVGPWFEPPYDLMKDIAARLVELTGNLGEAK